MIQLTRYSAETGVDEDRIIMQPEEIACVATYHYHSCRDPISIITLRCGKEIKVWETVDTVLNKMDNHIPKNQRIS